MNELDQVTKTPDGKHRNLVKTNIRNSQYFAALHRDAKSGIPHLHLVVNRIDKDGNINDCHFIGERAVAAAQAINQRHGWKDPMGIREEHVKQITNDCYDILRQMPAFSWLNYKTQLECRGYKVKLQQDKGGVVRGHSIKMGNSAYKSSELGIGRKLMPSKIEITWRGLHPIQRTMAVQASKPLDSKRPIAEKESILQTQPTAIPTSRQHEFVIDGKPQRFDIPEKVYKELDNYIVVPENSNATHEDVLKVAMLLFLDYVDAATQMSESVGGGGGVGTGWGKDKDEDELEWARRCAM